MKIKDLYYEYRLFDRHKIEGSKLILNGKLSTVNSGLLEYLESITNFWDVIVIENLTFDLYAVELEIDTRGKHPNTLNISLISDLKRDHSAEHDLETLVTSIFKSYTVFSYHSWSSDYVTFGI